MNSRRIRLKLRLRQSFQSAPTSPPIHTSKRRLNEFRTSSPLSPPSLPLEVNSSRRAPREVVKEVEATTGIDGVHAMIRSAVWEVALRPLCYSTTAVPRRAKPLGLTRVIALPTAAVETGIGLIPTHAHRPWPIAVVSQLAHSNRGFNRRPSRALLLHETCTTFPPLRTT